MGLLDFLKGKKEDNNTEKSFPWIPLTDINQLNEIKDKSSTKTQAIFKHSTRCGISSMVIKGFERSYNINTNADIYYLDLLNYRPISQAIAEKFNVFHQSPQLIVIKNGVVTHHASHHDIDGSSVK